MTNHPSHKSQRGVVLLSQGEAKAALEAISQMTDGNARSYDEWKLCTYGTKSQWLALLRAEAKIAAVVKG